MFLVAKRKLFWDVSQLLSEKSPLFLCSKLLHPSASKETFFWSAAGNEIRNYKPFLKCSWLIYIYRMCRDRKKWVLSSQQKNIHPIAVIGVNCVCSVGDIFNIKTHSKENLFLAVLTCSCGLFVDNGGDM